MLSVKGAWYTDSLLADFIVQTPDEVYHLAKISPFRDITEAELKPYKGYAPDQVSSYPMADYLYRFYGLELAPEENTTGWYTPREAAEYLGLTLSGFLHHANAKNNVQPKIPYIMKGNTRLYSRDQLDAFQAIRRPRGHPKAH
jgi:hypothetical protein